MTQTIATTSPLSYGSEVLRKSLESLKRIKSIGKLPLHDGHDGPQIGWVQDLKLIARDGMHFLMGTPTVPTKGLSLQYTATRIGNTLDIKDVIHVASVPYPRDPQSQYADSGFSLVTYSDSADEAPKDTPKDTPKEAPAAPDEAPKDTPSDVEFEITDDLIQAIAGRVLESPDLLAKFQSLLPKETPKESTGASDEAPKEVAKETPRTRFVLKPVTPQVTEAPKPKPKSIQQPFRAMM